ncbi:putative histidine acid phosphatase [Myriangium duriaei CBS 260.36]|uniref:Histidine acid phosphatase n=1 Tax=Myriangium duriaei CBS 260.36 TaxID=1168546 RepID=A0A9P4MGJ7_9PEZI|nr:putative histidine acid phosphatase [Myriangium duriaei CBS 260.36]
MKTTLLEAIALATSFKSTSGESGVGTFYPANLNYTSYIINNTGTYGGIYNSATYESGTNTVYGTYDYCFMPHPRVTEYCLPVPIADGSTKAKLVHLRYIQRHQRRTAYNLLPGGEDIDYDCSNLLPFLYAAPGPGSPAQQQPAAVYAATYTDPSNPFDNTSATGTCQYPQLTIGGYLDGLQHGQDLWDVYGKKLGLIPAAGPNSKIWFRSSESALTQQSAGAVISGIWPDYKRPVPLHQQPSAVDTVNAGFPCALRDTILSDIESTALWKEHLSVSEPLFDALHGYLKSDPTWTKSFDHLNDNFQARLCNGYGLPCPVHGSASEQVFRAGDWEWNYWWRNNANTSLYIKTVEGPFVGELLASFQAVSKRKSDAKTYVHDFLHDGDIGPIAGALGIVGLRWPGMGSNIAFEVWETEAGEFFARVLYSGSPMETIHGRLDWITLQKLDDILRPFVPTDAVSLCNS